MIKLNAGKMIYIWAVLALIGCSDKKIAEKINLADIPEQMIEEFRMIDTRMGMKNWKLEAVKASIYEGKAYIELEKPVMFFYEENEETSVISGNKGSVDQNTKIIRLNENVVVDSSKEALKLKTEELFYDTESKRIYSDEAVEIIRQGGITKGVGFESDSGFNRILIKDNETTIRN